MLKISCRQIRFLLNQSLKSSVNFRTLSCNFSEEMDELKSNPYYSKYAAKLEEAQKSSSQDFQQKLDELKKQKQQEKLPLTQPVEDKINSYENLSSIMNVDLLKEKSSDEVCEIWKDYHTEKDCVFAIIGASEYNDIREKSTNFPNFIYPVPRDGGYEFYIQRWVENVCHFTSLANFQKLGDNAPTCLSLYHYTELADSKEIVLMRGFPDLKTMSVYESQLLALQVKMYYGMHSGLKFNFVRIFNNSPETFRHMDLVVEFENYKKDAFAKKEMMGTPV